MNNRQILRWESMIDTVRNGAAIDISTGAPATDNIDTDTSAYATADDLANSLSDFGNSLNDVAVNLSYLKNVLESQLANRREVRNDDILKYAYCRGFSEKEYLEKFKRSVYEAHSEELPKETFTFEQLMED